MHTKMYDTCRNYFHPTHYWNKGVSGKLKTVGIIASYATLFVPIIMKSIELTEKKKISRQVNKTPKNPSAKTVQKTVLAKELLEKPKKATLVQKKSGIVPPESLADTTPKINLTERNDKSLGSNVFSDNPESSSKKLSDLEEVVGSDKPPLNFLTVQRPQTKPDPEYKLTDKDFISHFDGPADKLEAFLLQHTEKKGGEFDFTHLFFKNLTPESLNAVVQINNPQLRRQLLEKLGGAILQLNQFNGAAQNITRAYFKADPNSDLWNMNTWTDTEKRGHGLGVFSLVIAEEKTCHRLRQCGVSELKNPATLDKLLEGIRSDFDMLSIFFNKRQCNENYMHEVLSYLIRAQVDEGVEAAQAKLEVFVSAIVSLQPEEANDFTFNLITRAAHFDERPISKCCKHLPISDNFILTPIVLKKMISELAIAKKPWNFYVLHRIQTPFQAEAVIDAALQLSNDQKKILVWTLYQVFEHSNKFDIVKIITNKLQITEDEFIQSYFIPEPSPHDADSIFNTVFSDPWIPEIEPSPSPSPTSQGKIAELREALRALKEKRQVESSPPSPENKDASPD